MKPQHEPDFWYDIAWYLLHPGACMDEPASPKTDIIRPNGPLSPDEALALLIEGNRHFVDPDFVPRDYSVAAIARDKRHHPIAGVLACGDARVGAELIFDRPPGDLFMVRLAGNILSDYGLASLEYAVEFLGTPILMVLGHTGCGAVTAAVEVVRSQATLPGRLPELIDRIEPAVLHAQEQHPDDLLDAAIIENVRRQTRRLRTISPVVNTAQAAGTVRVVGAVYDMDTGEVRLIDA